MSKESYSTGFCKAAMANGVDPLALAEIKLSMMEKFALSAGGVNSALNEKKTVSANPNSTQESPAPSQTNAPSQTKKIDQISKSNENQFGNGVEKWWNGLEPWQKSLIGVGGGALLGGAIQKMLGGEAGATGAVIGGLGGLAASDVVDWNALRNAFSNEKKNPEVANKEVAKAEPQK